jgi:ring-1,2-phenylacetyl-CoA epoxidase subunit PaaE
MDQDFFRKLRIIDIVPETKDAKTFRLEPLEGYNPHYKAGQFLTLAFQTKYGEKRRSYSISSSPELDEYLSITVKKIDNGEFSRLLNYHAKKNDVLFTSGISGFFTLPEKKDIRQYFFLAAGSGITPCYSLIRTLLVRDDQSEVVLIYSNKSQADTIFFTQLKDLEEKHKARFRIKFLFSDIPNVYESRLSHWLLPQLLASYQHYKPKETLFYVCGPFDYMRMVEITLLSTIPKENIVKENFTSWPRLILPEPPDAENHKVTISFRGNEYQFDSQYPQNILATAKKLGIELPYSCEAGRCGSCAATCVSGKIWMAYNEVLTDKEVAQGRVLVCQAFAVGGDVRIEIV